eukprot:CAMPEP_0182418770 /NCGR_PEP_ID=MMETSP1167-20130531/3150_1 /TAXON_ID=2988 /ORGANISM="Mallomonas Sp, Strain CCMP3275" /LENGTH=207 /DNA_ID=CAMNT_0024593151 /DNA_START=198 /DNA_END=821 /DNA_ORIENTATION=-
MSLISKINIGELTKGTVLDRQELVPVFVASKDGWSSSKFHRKVDFNPPLSTIAVCKTKSGVLCGAFNALGWQSRDDYRDSLKTFLFKVNADGSVRKSSKIVGGPAVYDFGDRALWFSEGLFVPLNTKYMPIKRGRSSLGSSYTCLPSGESSVLGSGGDVELVEIECYASISMIQMSKNMYNVENDPQQGIRGMMNSFEKMIFGSDQK